jgi:hypothetical protein
MLLLGGAEGTRTPDPLHAMEVRYQLRYSPLWESEHYTMPEGALPAGPRRGHPPDTALQQVSDRPPRR